MEVNPAVRREGLVVDAGHDEVLIYDRRNDTAHCLDGAAALVWRAADGRRSLSEIARDCDLSEAAVAEVLLRLDGIELLVDDTREGVSRRALLRKIAKVSGAAVLAAPVISTVVIPAATAMASSCTNPGAGCGTVVFVGLNCRGAIQVDLRTACSGGAGCVCTLTSCETIAVASTGTYTCV